MVSCLFITFVTGRFRKIMTALINVSIRRESLFQLEKSLVSITVFGVSAHKIFARSAELILPVNNFIVLTESLLKIF